MKPFAFEGLKRQSYYKNYVTPREWKHGSRDMPFGLGAKSLYVDGTNGDDSNDGISWKTAKQKIQAAIDIAENWTNIFITTGAYNEDLVLSLENINLFGEQRDGVVVSAMGSDKRALKVHGNVCSINNMSFDMDDSEFCVEIFGDNCSMFDIKIDCLATTIGPDYCGLALVNLNACHLNQIVVDNAKMVFGVRMYNCDYCKIENCTLNLPNTDYIYTRGIYIAETRNSIVRGNEIVKAREGILADGLSSKNTIYHNNIISATYYLYDVAGANYWYENYIGGHTNVDNGFGIAKTPYTFSGGSDPRPVVVRNGWEFLSMGSTITNILEELELEAIHDSILFPEDTNETVTFTAGGAINTFGAWVEIVDNNAVTFSSKLTTHDGHISASSIESTDTNNKIYLFEVAYGAAKTVVVRHRFKSGVGVETFQSWRQKTLKIPTGETVYYRMKCETALATCTIDFRYHLHS